MKLSDRSNSDSFLEMELWSSIKSILPFSGGWAAGFQSWLSWAVGQACWLQGHHTARKNGMGAEQAKLSLLPRFTCFS